MPSAPANQFDRLQIRADTTRWVVLLGPEDGSDPTEADEVHFLRPIEIRRTSGAKQLDFARFAYDLGKAQEQLVDLQTPEQFVRIVEIRTRDSSGLPRGDLLFWGEITQQSVRIDEQGESVVIIARVETYHFGPPSTNAICQGMEIYDPVSEESMTVKHAQIAFNPLIDGRERLNMAVHENTADDWSYRLWLDAMSIQTEAAWKYNNDNQAPARWPLKQILRSIQGVCNASQHWIKNGDPDTVDRIATAEPIYDLMLAANRRLPEYLDAVLDATGFAWCLDYRLDGDDEAEVAIRLYDRTTGRERQVYLQAPGDSLQIADSNTDRPEVSWDIASLANKITCQGSVFERQITVELYRGWPVADDEKTADELDKSTAEFSPALENVWRLWVANEAGDWIGTRPTPALNPIPSVPLDLSDAFTNYVPRRRRFEDCLTRDAEGRIPPFVEWWRESDESWQPVPPEWGYRVLQDQMGIMFTGSTPPKDLIAQGDDAKIRVTAVITGDQRLEATAEPVEGDSPNGRDVELIVDVSDRFHHRQLVTTGPLANQLESSEEYGDDVGDDFDDLQDEADRIRDIEYPADLTADLPLFGLHYDYRIGDVITEIAGRNISLNRVSPGSRKNYYLQVTGIVWTQEPEQRTTLIVEPVEVA